MATEGLSKSKKIAAALLLLPLGIIIPFLSLESDHTQLTNAQSTNDTALAERVKKYKAAFKEEFRKNEQTRLSLRCEVAQTKSKAIASRLSSIQKTRVTAYDNILKSLNDLKDRLEDQAFETTELKENIATLDSKVNDFKTNMQGYTQAVSDLGVIDCKKDPIGYRAAIQVARNHHAVLVPLVGDIRTYITNTVKPTLQQIRLQIEGGQTTGGTSS